MQLYRIYDNVEHAHVEGHEFKTKADARRMRNTLNAMDDEVWLSLPGVTLRYTISKQKHEPVSSL